MTKLCSNPLLFTTYNLRSTKCGFTIVELLVVIVVIGILAAITIVSYTGITSRAVIATLQSDLKNASTQLGIDNVTNGSYPASEADANGGKGLPKSSGTNYQYIVTSTNYCISASSIAAGSTTYHISSASGTVEAGVCPLTWKQIAAGNYFHTCGIASNNLAYCWGENGSGELGNNKWDDSLVPDPVYASGVLRGKTILVIEAGGYHTCSIASDNLAYCWGGNHNGDLGNNSSDASDIPVAVNMANGVSALYGKTIKSISVGDFHNCVIASDDLAYCWGYNFYGSLGNNSTNDSGVPIAVNMVNGVSALYGKTIKSITAGGMHTCVIASDDLAYCWGYNSNGQLGNNSTTQSNVPVAVNMANGVSALYGKTIKSIKAGYEHTCAIASDNLAYCWGKNNRGQLGDNSTTRKLVPVAIDMTNGVSALYGKTISSISHRGNGDSNCVIASDNLAYCWGYNASGQLGNNSTTQSLVPISVNYAGVLSGKTIKDISIGFYHTCAIASNDLSYCWGENGGKLGDGSIIQSLVPVAVVSLSLPPPPPPSPPLPTIIFSSQELYVAWPGNDQTVCKQWTVPSGNTIKGFYVSQATESDYDYFTVSVDEVEKYRQSGEIIDEYTDISSSPGDTLSACIETDSSTQTGFGGEVTGVYYN